MKCQTETLGFGSMFAVMTTTESWLNSLCPRGTHTLEIARREDGTLLDAIAVIQ